jgi:PII-like signaling protein
VTPDKLDLLKFTLNASDYWDGQPLHEAIVSIAQRDGVAGASVFGAELGYGHDRGVQDTLSEYSSSDPPLTIEIVDTPAMIDSLLETLRPMVQKLLITRNSCAPLSPNLSLIPASQETRVMTDTEDAYRVSIYLGSNDTWQGKNLAIALVEHCRTLGFAGITVTRGVMGFGKSAHIHKIHPFHFSQELPEKLEVIDTPERIGAFLSSIHDMVINALVLIEKVEIIRYNRS